MDITYAEAGVDYAKIAEFKNIMRDLGRRTATFSRRRNVYVSQTITHAHGAIYEYRGETPHLSVQTTEGLGNKNWIAEWMYRHKANGKTFYRGIGIDTALMAVNDCIAQGAMPVIFTDEIAAGDSGWFTNLQRARDLALGFEEVCRLVGMAMPQGESTPLRYIVNARAPVDQAPVLSGCVTGIIAPIRNLVTRDRIEAGDAIIGVASSGIHANGISIVIEVAKTLTYDLLTPIPRADQSLGEEALIPTRSYVALIEGLLANRVPLHGIIPGTGDGVRKLCVHRVPYTYVIERWVKVPRLFLFMRSCGVPLEECLTTFNWGVGCYLFVPRENVEQTLVVGLAAGYRLAHIGFVEEGPRQVVFEPAGATLVPPNENGTRAPSREKNVGKDPLFGYGSDTEKPRAPQISFEE